MISMCIMSYRHKYTVTFLNIAIKKTYTVKRHFHYSVYSEFGELIYSVVGIISVVWNSSKEPLLLGLVVVVFWGGFCCCCFLIFYLLIYFWLCWVFVSVRGLSLVTASRGHSSSRCWGHSSSRCAGLSLSRPLLLRSTGSRCAGSVVVAHRPSCSAARGIFPDQGLNPCPLHWQTDSQPLRHQGSPGFFFNLFCRVLFFLFFSCNLNFLIC